MARLNIMCDGDTCAVVGAELRCYAFPGFTRTFCEPCFRRQNLSARRIAAASSIPDLWPVLDWETAETYKRMERQKDDTL